MGFLGYITLLLVGITLAVIGGGGSILTVPILVYLFNEPPEIATSYSLFLVGVSSALASITYIRKSLVDFRIGFVFSVPSFIGVFLVRKFLMPAIPKQFAIISLNVSKDSLILFVFAIIMLLASLSMIRGRKESLQPVSKKLNIPLIALEGLLVGGLTGFVGAGGGFLIIPALVILTGLSMKKAVGTSLMIITFKSLIGFTGDIGVQQLNWSFLLTITMISLVGIMIGSWLEKYVKAAVLKPLFGYFILLMGCFILVQQLIA